MKDDEMSQVEKITPDKLLSLIGLTPVDNLQGQSAAVAWKSNLVGLQVRGLLGYHKILDTISKEVSVFGPWSLVASWQSSMLDAFVTGPIKAQARMAVGSSRNPDLFGDMNGWIYKGHSRLLYTFMTILLGMPV